MSALHACVSDTGLPPTIEELRQHLNLGSTRTVLRYLQQAEADGLIVRWPGARGLKLKDSTVCCAFCTASGFSFEGLKNHLMDHCTIFEQTLYAGSTSGG